MATTNTTSKTTSKATKVDAQNKNAQQATPNYCSLVEVPERVFAPEVGTGRAAMIRIIVKKWVNGTKLKYYFFNGSTDGSPATWKGASNQITAVKNAFKAWKNLGIGLEFEEVNDKNDAQIRIGFMRGDGSWSYVGRDIIDVASSPNERTMNFGWDISNDPDTAIHEIGHTLGAPHEHQNPYAGIVWNEEAVYNALAQSPNFWSREKTYHNIIRKLPVNEVEGSTHDPDSVMHYPFGPGLILSPIEFKNGIYPAGGLSLKDIEFVKKFYPALQPKDYIELKSSRSEPLDIKPGEQKNFKFKPTRSKKYKIETFGTMDTVMVLFEKNGTEEIYLAGDDDSGTDLNSKIYLRLIKGREYIIRLRLFYAEDEGSGSLMVY
ncbi:M12 family metallopeptidase [Flavobacterium sp. H122]|uniref:M12 family metallopeptidase n=1 Tax=Flavobacterium sp. H122 TaxID=2529860 RepID=UPI0010A9BCDE|nr:M12 family metallopeptidase [Flavobacterium sp. H122]